MGTPVPMHTPRVAVRRVAAALAVVAAGALVSACGDDADEADGPAPSTSAVVGPTASTEPAPTTLSESATCDDYLRATAPARENATRAALILARRAAGVEREPASEVRARFQAALDLACREQPAAPMLDVMGTVLEQGGEAYVG